jgi:hypothetical protein
LLVKQIIARPFKCFPKFILFLGLLPSTVQSSVLLQQKFVHFHDNSLFLLSIQWLLLALFLKATSLLMKEKEDKTLQELTMS